MSDSRWERLAPLTGVIFFVLIAVTFALSSDTPDVDSSTSDTVSYWSAHDSRLIVASVVGTFAALFLIWFGASLRSALLRAERGEGRLSTLVFAGFIVIGVTGAIGSSLQFAVADSAGDVPDQVTQALSVLSSDFFLPFVVGSLLVLFATGVCILRFGGLPRWLGWAAIGIGIVSLAGPIGFIGFLALMVWILVVSITLYLRQDDAAAPAKPTKPTS